MNSEKSINQGIVTSKLVADNLVANNLINYQVLLDTTLARLREESILSRIWAMDHTVWNDNPQEITNRLGWLQVARVMHSEIPRIEAFVQSVRGAGYTHVLLLGMGGSSLAPEVMTKSFGIRQGYLDLAVLDSTDPGAVLDWASRLNLAQTLFVVSTKSGGTVETFSFFKYFYNLVAEAVGVEQAGEHFIAITDPGSGLAETATRYRFRETFLNDPQIGGRYSALSYFGLVPAALIGVDLSLLLKRATDMMKLCAREADNPALYLGAMLGELAKAGRDKLALIITPEISSFGDWIEQLIAESTGKNGKGILPVAGESPAAPDVYGDDRLFVFVGIGNGVVDRELYKSLESAGHPLLCIFLVDVYDLGGQFFLWELATAVAGHCLGINPFDQPNVEAAKVLARKVVDEYKHKGVLTIDEPAPLDPDRLSEFISLAQPGDYIALQAYLNPTGSNHAHVVELRKQLRDQTRLATTLGYGPRYLHSTGQLHKGDAGRGLFIQLTAEAERDAAIPDEAGRQDTSISFAVLEMAQAYGDRQALREAGRKVIRFHLGGDIESSIKRLTGL